MNPKTTAQTTGENFTRNMAGKGREWKGAARQWAGDAGERLHDNVKKAGYYTETYVRDYPGWFIVGACCLGLAAGYLLGCASKRRR